MITQDICNQAAAFAFGLELGAVSVAEVIAWADSVIVAEPIPPWAICEVAMMGRKHKIDVVSALREVPGTPNPEVVGAAVIRSILHALVTDRTVVDQVVQALYYMANDDLLPSATLAPVAWSAWDELSLADDRVILKTRDEVIDDIIEALRQAAKEVEGDP